MSAPLTFRPLKSCKVIDFGTNRHSKRGPTLHRFGDIAGFVLLTSPLFHRNFRSVSVAPDRQRWGSMSRCIKLFGREIISNIPTATYVITIP